MAETRRLDLDQDLVVSQLLIDLDWLELEWSPWLGNDKSVAKHIERNGYRAY